MSKMLLLAVMLFVCSAAPAVAQQTDIFGYYYIEKPTRAFADISEIHLGGSYGASLRPPLYGLIRMKSRRNKDYLLKKPVLTGREIRFTTRAVSGISYAFSGRFTKLGNFPVDQPEGVVLRGTLTKMKGTTKLAEANVDFTYFAGD